MTKRKIQYWVIAPEADAEFVASMEEVLETYARPLDPNIPVICMDEQPVQLVKETRQTIPATKDHPQRVDYEYERAGTACVFMYSLEDIVSAISPLTRLFVLANPHVLRELRCHLMRYAR